MNGILMQLVMLVCLATRLTNAFPVDVKAAEPIAGQLMTVDQTLAAAAERLRAHPFYEQPRPVYSPTTLSSSGSSGTVSPGDATERFLANPTHVWDNPDKSTTPPTLLRTTEPFPSNVESSQVATKSVKGDRAVTTFSSVRASPVASFRGFFTRTLEKIRNKFRLGKKPVDLPSTPEFSFPTPNYRWDETSWSSTPDLYYSTPVNDHHPYFGPLSQLDPEHADRTPFRIVTERPKLKPLAAVDHNFQGSVNVPISFGEPDAELARVAKGLRPLRISTTADSLERTHKGKHPQKLQVSSIPESSDQASRAAKTEKELNGVSRLYFARTGHILHSLQISSPNKELDHQVNAPPTRLTLYEVRKGRALPAVRIPKQLEPPKLATSWLRSRVSRIRSYLEHLKKPSANPQDNHASLKAKNEKLAAKDRGVMRRIMAYLSRNTKVRAQRTNRDQ